MDAASRRQVATLRLRLVCTVSGGEGEGGTCSEGTEGGMNKDKYMHGLSVNPAALRCSGVGVLVEGRKGWGAQSDFLSWHNRHCPFPAC